MKAALLIASARRLARPSLARGVAIAASNALVAPAASSSWVSTRQATPAAMTLLTTRAFSSTKKPKASGDGSGSDSESDDDEASDDDDEEADEDDDDEDEDDEEEEDEGELRAAARAAFSDEDLAKFNEDDDWDEARWGKLDSEDWQGFDGDLDAVTEEGVPKWLQSVRDLSAIHQEKRMRAKLARRALEEAKMNVVRHRKVDELGRAYGTGRRKTSTARVWIKKSSTPFDGRIKINKKDLTALQHFDPALRPALKKQKLLMRDPRGVERKKAGQKKARKKFQWVKR